jgi:uncharacterized protein YkwD
MTSRPSHRLALLAAVIVGLALLVLAFMALAPAGASAQTQAQAQQVSLTPAEQDALNRINAYRTGMGLKPVALDPTLQREAEWYAQDMAAHDNFNHDHRDSLGRLPASRLASFGFKFPDLAAENSAAGYADGFSTFEQWRLSPPHERTMRESTYRIIGIAAAYQPGTSSGWYWVSTFGPDPNRSRQSIEDQQAEEDSGGKLSVTVKIPMLPRVVVTPCAAEQRRGGERCVEVTSNTHRAPTELQIQRRGAGNWSKATFATDESKMIRIRRGTVRVRVLVYDPDNHWPTRGPWRVIRPTTPHPGER